MLNGVVTKGLLFFVFILLPCFWVNAQEGEELDLETAIKEAIEKNPKIQQVIQRELAAVEEKKAASKDLLFKISTNYSYTRLKDEPYTIFPKTNANRLLLLMPDKIPMSDKDRVTWDFTLTQPIFTGFALISKKQIADLGIDVARYEKEVALIELSRQVKIAYFNVLLAKRALEIAKDEVTQLDAHVKDAQRFFQEGVVAKNDVLKSQVALADAKRKEAKAQADLETALAFLKILIGRPIDDKVTVQDVEPILSPSAPLHELFEDALKTRPEISLLDTKLKQAGLAIRIARSVNYPQISIVAQYERVGDDVLGSRNEFGNDHNASITLVAKMSIFEWGKSQNEIKKAVHQMTELQEKLREIRDSITMEVKQAFENLKVAETTIDTARVARAQARENFRITNLQYQEGITTSTEVLDARAYLTQAENNYFKALYGYKLAEADLIKAVGKR